MNKARKAVEIIKNDFRKQIISDADSFKRSIIREIELRYRLLLNKNPDITLEQVSEKILSSINFNGSFKLDILQEIKQADKEISSVWNSYFKNIARKEFVPADYEKIVSLSKVNFNTLDQVVNNTVEKEFSKAVSGKYNFEALVSSLKKRDVGDASAYTLANTSVAQFDNAYHVESARQAGIESFLYDGDVSTNTREFCLEHVGNVYTIDEIKDMDNGQGLPVETSCGGYNCQHYLTADFGG